MLTKFDEQAQKAIVVGESIAFDLGHNNVGSEHLLLSLLKISDSKLKELVKKYNVNDKCIYEDIKRLFGANDDQPFYMEYSEAVKNILETAVEITNEQNKSKVTLNILTIALLKSEESVAYELLKKYQVDFEDIYTEGITKISKEDMMYAKAMGMTIKLLATSKRQGDLLQAMVAPYLLRKEHPLYSVNDVFNAIFVHGNVLGDAMFYGSGAGKLPTASAVVADVVDEAKHLHRNIMTMWKSDKLELLPFEDTSKRFFVRISGEPEALKAHVESKFGPVEIIRADGLEGEFGFLTGVLTERAYKENAKEFPGILHRIRVEG